MDKRGIDGRGDRDKRASVSPLTPSPPPPRPPFPQDNGSIHAKVHSWQGRGKGQDKGGELPGERDAGGRTALARGDGRWGNSRRVGGEKVLRDRARGSLGGRIILSASFSCRASQGTCPWPATAQQEDFLWLLTLPVPWDVSHQDFVLLGKGNGERALSPYP